MDEMDAFLMSLSGVTPQVIAERWQMGEEEMQLKAREESEAKVVVGGLCRVDQHHYILTRRYTRRGASLHLFFILVRRGSSLNHKFLTM